ncbi:hypothetical protein OJF2_69170 [Aquisphaera giovannonii]|uniref:DUF2252 domain-containing protein n=1 Tax=Aquisphaera giovannonii TaxID=406548 RepID=A0A5B9WCI1_9BACT|nr:DUF2252 domain-containing protein [Aquisphaera giovannonii]QEH38316.1 hypothetical protein OJF2_69170 [Aquisphaera giovannonii]
MAEAKAGAAAPGISAGGAQPAVAVEEKPASGKPDRRREASLLRGRSIRSNCPRSSHAGWRPAAGRPDPVALLEESSKGRIPDLIPVRYGRMMASPFAFFRGAAMNMAADLAGTPATGLRVQACGDCHLLNFGGFATPERRLVFDINDFDETLPAPWEWDLKRLATSFVLAGRDNRFAAAQSRDAALACVRSYRESMAGFARMRALDVWYQRADLEGLIPRIEDEAVRKGVRKRLEKAREQSAREHADPRLAEVAGGEAAIRDSPPLIYHFPGEGRDAFTSSVITAFAGYRESLADDRKRLLDRFALKDMAMKVVGVGSVGTFCAVVLLLANEDDPLFLQVKEARASVLEPYAGESVYANHGRRVVNGCRLMQSASDLFLGWTELEGGQHYHVRQLKDMKIKPTVEVYGPGTMLQYAELCGWTVARAHSRSGEPAEIAGYLGKSDAFDQAVADFAVAYADQTEADHRALEEAVKSGRLRAVIETPAEEKADGKAG